MNLEWAHAIIGMIGVTIGAAGGIFTGGWRLGRIESRLKLSFQTSISECEKRFEDKVDMASKAFDETLKGLRQKINDVELDSERRFVNKPDFGDFIEEYRSNTRRIFEKLDHLPVKH